MPHFDEDIPEWNVLPITTNLASKKSDSPWIYRSLECASQWVTDDGLVLVFFPDSKFILSEVEGWSKLAGFKLLNK